MRKIIMLGILIMIILGIYIYTNNPYVLLGILLLIGIGMFIKFMDDAIKNIFLNA